MTNEQHDEFIQKFIKTIEKEFPGLRIIGASVSTMNHNVLDWSFEMNISEIKEYLTKQSNPETLRQFIERIAASGMCINMRLFNIFTANTNSKILDIKMTDLKYVHFKKLKGAGPSMWKHFKKLRYL